MEKIESVLKFVSDALWGNWLMYVFVCLGIYCSVSTRFIQVRKFPYTIKLFITGIKENYKHKSKEISGIQALLAAIASCVGSGNIVGVSTAILAGGSGALFWMWFSAFLGMATKFSEIVLGMIFREKNEEGEYVGGPMYYIAKGLKIPILGTIVAILLFFQNASGTFIQANTIANVIKTNLNVPVYVVAIITAVIISYIISGGFRRLVRVTEKIVPVMAILYITMGLIVIIMNISNLPQVFTNIFSEAFSFKAASGAVIGLSMKRAMRYGIARGIYSNEAGEGSAAVIHSTANVSHPVEQGLYGTVEVFIDTIVICSITGLSILITDIPLDGANASTLATVAFGSVMPIFKYVVTVSLVLFAFTSMMSQWYFGHVSLTYLKLKKGKEIYKILFPIAIIIGSLVTIDMAWYIQDCFLGLLIIPNIAALFILMPHVRRSLKDYELKNKKT